MRALAVLLLTLSATQAGAVEIRSYEFRLRVDADGAGRAIATVRLEGATPGQIVLPLGFATVGAPRCTDGPAGTTVVAQPHNGQTLVEVTLPDPTPPSTTVGFELDVAGALQRPAQKPGEPSAAPPAGRYTFRHALLNTQPATVGRYRFELRLPDGMRAHAIREALPRLRPGEAGPRAQLDGVDGQPGVWLQVDRLLQGETAVVQVELVPRSRSLVWLVIGVVLSLFYLVKFRDLVARAG